MTARTARGRFKPLTERKPRSIKACPVCGTEFYFNGKQKACSHRCGHILKKQK